MTIGPCGGAHADSRRRVRALLFVAAACVVAAIICLGTFRSASAATGRMAPTSRIAATPSAQAHSATMGLGYWLAASDGGIFSEGGAPFKGSSGSTMLNKPVVGMAPTPDGNGYWLVAADGGIFNYGDAPFEGSAGALKLNQPIVGMAATPDGKGYWLVASDGGIFNYGDAPFEGSAGALKLNQPIVGMAAAPDGKGYWLVASDGGIFNYGDAAFAGSTGGTRLNEPIVGMASAADGKGYWLVASDGGIFNYGDAAFDGSAGGTPLNKPIVGMAAAPDGKGYWLVASDGGIFNYGDSDFDGSTGGLPLNKPIVGMAVSSTFGAASKLVFSTQPGGASGGIAFSTQPVVKVEDAAGDPVSTNHSAVTIEIATGTPTTGGPGALSTCTSSGESNGVFTFSGCTINTVGDGYKLIATDGQLTSATSAALNVSAGLPTHITFTTQPSNAIGGDPFLTQPVVTIRDAGNNTVVTDTSAIVLTIHSGPGALAGCSATTAAGTASFSGCSIDTAGTYTLTATDAVDTLTTTSGSFDVGTGVPSQLAVSTSPAGAPGGTVFTTQPVVAVEDAGGNTVTGDTSTVTLSLTVGTPTAGGPGALSGCTPTAAINGVATFTGCSINTAGAGYEVHAVDGSLTPADSAPFNVTVGTANHLAFTTSPAGATGGTAFTTQPVVMVKDAGGNTVTGDTTTVTLSITAGTPAAGGPGSLSGCAPTAAINGVATFTGCSINTAGTGYELHAADGSLTAANSAPFDVTVGTASQLAVTTSPAGATGGTAFTTQPVVMVKDAGGNTVTGDTTTVTLSITAGTPAAGGPGSLSGCAPTAAINGVATFTGCSINTAGTGYELHAADGSLTAANSAPFDVTVGQGNQLVFTVQPGSAAAGSAFGTQPVVTIEDAGGNTVTTDTDSVTMAIGSGAGAISGCSETTTAGVATFTGCSINTTGPFRLRAGDGVINEISNPFTVT